MIFSVGNRVEVIGDGVFTKALMAAYVLDFDQENVVVQYETSLTEDGVGVVDAVPRARLRSYPSEFMGSICYNDKVDVWIGGAWLIGECIGSNENEYNVRFEFVAKKHSCRPCRREDVRKHQVWVADGPNSRFGRLVEVEKPMRECPNTLLVARVLDLFEDGVQVEYYNLVTMETQTHSMKWVSPETHEEWKQNVRRQQKSHKISINYTLVNARESTAEGVKTKRRIRNNKYERIFKEEIDTKRKEEHGRDTLQAEVVNVERTQQNRGNG
ncbi:hypothetical protein LXL04_015688 [Taraxacum kok-saghyz]